MSIIFVSLHVFPFNETLNALLNCLGIWLEFICQDFRRFCDQCVVVDSLSRLHYLHNSGVDYVFSIIVNFVGEVN